MHKDSDAVVKAKKYLRGEALRFDEIYDLWNQLKMELEFGYAHRVLALLRKDSQISDGKKPTGNQRVKMCQQHALCVSKDSDLSAAVRHDDALEILGELLVGDKEGELTDDPETLGIAGGTCKRKWEAFGQIEDLKQSLKYYQRGAEQPGYKDYGYTAINTAFVLDLLAELGEDPENSRDKARLIRETLIQDLPKLHEKETGLSGEWWFQVTLAETYFGLGHYNDAIRCIEAGLEIKDTPYWEFETTARQFAALAFLQSRQRADAARVLGVLLRDSNADIDSILVGKVGLALSGGGFRASLYHLGVLARLAELNVLRHIDVLSCVSGGSIVGAYYYLAIRSLLMARGHDEISQSDYVELIKDLIRNFKEGMGGGLRDADPSKLKAFWRVVTKQGALDTSGIAERLEQEFYSKYESKPGPIWLDELMVEPKDHNPAWKNQGVFNPKRHNWQRKHKVLSLVLNATTMNTGHCWQFTVSSMGETPFALHKEVDSIPRLRRSWYRPATGTDPGRRVMLGQAVAASAAVPGIFEPLSLKGLYPDKGEPYDIRLVDGGVYDNQGSHGLLAHDCNVIIVSDAAGQLTADNNPPDSLLKATPAHAIRSGLVLMERIRHAGFADLKARLQSKLLRGLMFVHMKAGLYVEPIGWAGCQESYTPPRQTPLTPSGVRRDVQQALAELRTDLDDFIDEADYLMACGYQMAAKSFEGSLASIEGLSSEGQKEEWEFDDALALITSTSEMTAQDRQTLLNRLAQGAKVNTG